MLGRKKAKYMIRIVETATNKSKNFVYHGELNMNGIAKKIKGIL